MDRGLRLWFLALYAVGPALALLALLRRAGKAATAPYRVRGWRCWVPALLLPAEWLLPPALILSGVGDIRPGWLPVRLLGFTVSLCGAALLAWASVALGRFFVHAAAVFDDHALVRHGPYRFLRHPVYASYLALLLGTGLGMLNAWLLLLWPLSLLGILVQAAAEEQLLRSKFGPVYRGYAGRTGRLLPRLCGRVG
jgi:protein-S-isoprenylcysteine O-methyltransferase Ste14